jgi:hypothetical protein
LVERHKRLRNRKWKASAVKHSVVLALAILLVTPACVPDGLSFVQDDRVEIIAPDGNTEVDLPVTIEWTIEDFDVTGPGTSSSDRSGYFAVFVDGTPIPPGEPLDWIARDDTRCQNTPGCPDETYFSDRNVFTTTDTEFTIEHLPDQDTTSGHETHEVTVVLLDPTGHRIGESAWFVTMFYERGPDE